MNAHTELQAKRQRSARKVIYRNRLIQLKKRGFDVYVLEIILSSMWQALLHGLAGLIGAQGRAVQVDPMKPTLKLPGAMRLKPKHHDPVSNLLSNSTCAATPRRRCCWSGARLRRQRRRCQWGRDRCRGGQWERDRWRAPSGGVTGGGAASGGVPGGGAASGGVSGGGAASRGVTVGGAASGSVTGGALPVGA